MTSDLSELSVSQAKMGDTLCDLGRFNEALDAYRRSLDTVEKMVAEEPGNEQRQRDLAERIVPVPVENDAAGAIG